MLSVLSPVMPVSQELLNLCQAIVLNCSQNHLLIPSFKVTYWVDIEESD